MSKRPTDLLLNDIRESIDRIEKYTEGMSLEDFSKDRKTIDAVARNLEIMGEAANRLPDEFKEIHSDVEWYKIVGCDTGLFTSISALTFRLSGESCRRIYLNCVGLCLKYKSEDCDRNLRL